MSSSFAGILESATDLEILNQIEQSDLELATLLSSNQILKNQILSSIFKVSCAIDFYESWDCIHIKAMNRLMNYESFRRKKIEESIVRLNHKRAKSTENEIREAELYIFKFGTEKEKDRVAF